MKNIQTNSRVSYVDIAKGFGMLAVLWGHIMLSGYTNILVYAVHIPLFFFLSGMVYKKEKYSSLMCLIKSRVKSLLIPYVIFSTLTWILWLGYSYLFNIKVTSYIMPFLQTFIAQGSGGYMEHNVPLWFVTCLFIVEVLYYFISKTKPFINILISTILAVIGHLMVHNNFIDFDFTKLPWNIEAAMSAVLFYSIGNLFVSKYGLKYIPDFLSGKKTKACIITISTILVLCIGSPFNGSVTLGHNKLGNNTIAFYFIAFCGIIATLFVSGYLEKINFKIINILKWIGRNSFYFMAIHVPADGVVSTILSKILNVSSSVMEQSLLYSTIIFIITLILCSIAVIIINKYIDMLKRPKQSV